MERAILLRLNSKLWPKWQSRIPFDRTALVWFKSGRLRQADVRPRIEVFVLATGGLGLVATGEAATGIERRSDPDWQEVAEEFQAEYREPKNRLGVNLQQTAVALAQLEDREELRGLHRRRETATWLSREQRQALREIVAVSLGTAR